MRQLPNFFKGMAMGAADVVPGVSGGTVAFITGILEPLLDAIRKVKPSLIGIIKEKGLYTAFLHINGFFLLAVFGGILTSILSLAKIISWLLAEHPIPVWSFFFGLILYSVIHMLKHVERFSVVKFILFSIGAAFAWTITMLTPIALEANYLSFLIAGSIAICAMILPGISGSFILLLLGLYPSVLAAVKGFQFDFLATFAVGCLIGLLTFSHILAALLRKFHDQTVMFLTGLMLGTLGKIWPYKETLTWRTNSQGEQVALSERNLLPMQFEQVTGESSQLLLALVCLLLGIALVWSLERFGSKALA